MKDKNAVVKKIKRGLKLAVAGVLMSAMVVPNLMGCQRNDKFDDYAATSQIVSVMDEFDCDDSYLSKLGDRYVQMQHNGDEPIYVCFDEEFNQEELESAKKSLDEIFGIVGKINKNYRYEIVSKSEYYSKINRSKIYYDLGKLKNVGYADAQAYIIRKPNLISMLTNKRTYNNYRLVYNRHNYISDEDRDYTFMHELFHAFGVDDLYYMKKDKRVKPKALKTLIDTDYGDGVGKLTVNDVKCLISLYQEKKETQEEQEEYMDQMKDFLQEYEKEYYLAFEQKCKENLDCESEFDERKIQTISHLKMWAGGSNKFEFDYHVKVLDNKYSFTIKNKSGEVLDSCKGEVVWTDAVAVLKDIKLKEGLYPNMPEGYVKYDEFVQDLALIKYDNEHVLLYDLGTCNLMDTDTIVLTSNELTNAK